MKILFTISLFLTTVTGAFAQRQNVYFIKNNGRYVDVRDSADYIRVVREPDSASTLYNVLEYYPNGTKKLIGRSSKINPPRFEGQCVTFFPNGQRETINNYKNNQKVGERIEFFPNGKIYRMLTYSGPLTVDGVPRLDLGPRFSGSTDEYLVKADNDSLGNAFIVDGNGYYKGYDDKFTYVEEEGTIKNGKRDGQWKGDFRKASTTFTEKYNNGSLLSGTATNKEGKVSNYTKVRYAAPEFKGGVEAFGRFLSRKINYDDEARRQNIEGTVILTFVVEKDGSLTDIRVLKSVMGALDNEAVRVLKLSPPWVPGTEFGLPVRVRYSVPVSFAMRK
jgi:TonB family protein